MVRGASPRGGPSRIRALVRAATPAHTRTLPILIVLLALGLRIVVVAADSGYRPANDGLEYNYYARSIAAGDGFPRSGYLLQGGPTAVRGPAYPYFLAGVYSLTDDSVTAGRIAGAVLGAIVVLLVYLIARRIWGRRVGLIAAGLGSVFPPLVLVSRELLSEPLFITLELAAILSVLNFRRSGGRLTWAVSAGALCGLAALTRQSALALVAPVLIGLWVPRLVPSPGARLRALGSPAVAVLVAVLVITPWTIRNAIDFGRLVPITTSSGISLAGTYNEASFRDSASHGAWRDPQVVPQFRPLFVTPGLDEAAVDAALRRRAVDFAVDHPGYDAEVFGWNLLRMFEITGGSVVGAHNQVLSEASIGSADPASERIGLAIIAALAILGVVVILRSKPRVRLAGRPRFPRGPLFLWLVPILFIVTSAPVGGLPRYRLPADPFLLIAAAIGLVSLYEVVTRGSRAAQ